MEDHVVLPLSLQERLLRNIRERWPLKSFGYIVAEDNGNPIDFILFQSNMRNVGTWKNRFHSYGSYFVQHDDAGFVATPEESLQVHKEMCIRGVHEVGIFHSHLRHPANFSQPDYSMHIERFHDLWHLIISMRNPEFPQMRAFKVSDSEVRELRLLPSHPISNRLYTVPEASYDDAISSTHRILELDGNSRPACRNNKLIFRAIDKVLKTKDMDLIDDLLVNGFLQGSGDRFLTYVAPLLCSLSGGSFQRGTEEVETRHFCGESPRRTVELSPFSISRIQITNELLSVFDPKREDVSTADRQKPAGKVTWFDASVFAMWMGCRLPTEAEWEFACGAGNPSEWCCETEELLPKYAWYSENSAGELHAVGMRKANQFGLFDLHGNVWEWCQDVYEQDYYCKSPISNPINRGDPEQSEDRVCRGGSIHALAEMCRTRYRLHEPPEFWAPDLGFRLAWDGGSI
jgi:formylglycine-generating enzyme required for sulfatase activity/proteasome lid subunit RPN8/RPN11